MRVLPSVLILIAMFMTACKQESDINAQAQIRHPDSQETLQQEAAEAEIIATEDSETDNASTDEESESVEDEAAETVSEAQ